MLRTVADDTPSPAAVTSTEEATGSPDVMNSRTSAASTRLDRSLAASIVNPGLASVVISSPNPRVLTGIIAPVNRFPGHGVLRAERRESHASLDRTDGLQRDRHRRRPRAGIRSAAGGDLHV